MSQLWMDGFDHYGGDKDKMLDGAWAEINLDFPLSNTIVRTGEYSAEINAGNIMRRVNGVETNDVIVSLGLYNDQLPTSPTSVIPVQFRAGDNSKIATIVVKPDGVIEAYAGAEGATLLGQTTGPVIVAGSWQHFECEILRHASAGTIEVRVDEVVVLNLAALALGAVNISQIAIENSLTGGGSIPNFFIDDVIVRDDSGTFNNDFEGDLRVATLQPISNAANQGWATRSIQKIDIGVLDLLETDRDKAVAYTDNAVFEIGSGDFTIETFVRFQTAPAGTEEHTILSKWRQDDDTRSWRLHLEGPSASGNLIFSTSNLGTLADVVEVHAFPFVPIENRWYHVEIDRSGTDSHLFLDGVQIGITQTDSRAYFDGAADIMINALQGVAVDTALINTGINGWVDGTRLTVGAALHTANFTPPSVALTAGANSELVLNYDDVTNPDDSTNAFVGTFINSAVPIFPDDSIAYQTIAGLAPIDNDFVEATLVAATGTLTLTGNALDTETLTLGSTTYTLQTVLVDAANNVLIGATASDTLDNLRAAINLEAGAGTLYGTATLINAEATLSDLPGDQALAAAKTPGTAANTEPTTTTITGASWSAATLLGGLDIPTNSEFNLSALPAEVTGVRSLTIIGRNFKTDSGAATMQMSFVTAGGTSAAGADNPLTVNPVYYEDTIEQDPDTSGALTPATVNGSRIRLNRTT